MQNKKGFTLVELMIAMFIATILIAGVYAMFISVHNMNEEQQAFIEAQTNLGSVSQIVEKDIRKSSQHLDISVSGNSTVITQLDKEGNIIKDDEGNPLQYSYELMNGKLYRNNRFLSEHIESFEVHAYPTEDPMYIYLKVNAKTRRREVNHDKKIYLRKN